MKNTAIEKLSYTEVTKNISQAEYNQTQEEYILSKSPDKYMISLPDKVLMFEGAKDSSPFTYYFYMANDEDLYLMHAPISLAGITFVLLMTRQSPGLK